LCVDCQRRLADFLFCVGQSERVVVGIFATQANNRARRGAAFVDKATSAAREELREFRGGANWEFEPECIEDFLPHQAAAVDHAVRGLQIHQFTLRKAGASQTYFVETDHLGGVAIEHDEWRHVLNDAGHAADHRHAADPAELVYGRTAAQIGTLPDFDVPTQHRAIGQNDVVLHFAIVGSVSVHHEQAVTADAGHMSGGQGSVHRDVFAEYVAIADFGRTGVFGHVDMLRHAADHRAFEYEIIATQYRARLHRHASGQMTAVSQHHSGFDNAKGTNPHIASKLSVWTNDGKRMNRHRRVLSEMARLAPQATGFLQAAEQFAVLPAAKDAIITIGRSVCAGLTGGADFSLRTTQAYGRPRQSAGKLECAAASLQLSLACAAISEPRASAAQSISRSNQQRIAMSNPVALYDEADKLKDQGKLDEAVAKLNEALQADQNYALAHSALAVVLQRLGKHEEAIQHARKVCEIEPNDAFSFTALSVTYQRAFAGTNNQQFIRMAEDAMEQSRMLQSGH
jgi:tetratricopeptide repeat protein